MRLYGKVSTEGARGPASHKKEERGKRKQGRSKLEQGTRPSVSAQAVFKRRLGKSVNAKIGKNLQPEGVTRGRGKVIRTLSSPEWSKMGT